MRIRTDPASSHPSWNAHHHSLIRRPPRAHPVPAPRQQTRSPAKGHPTRRGARRCGAVSLGAPAVRCAAPVMRWDGDGSWRRKLRGSSRCRGICVSGRLGGGPGNCEARGEEIRATLTGPPVYERVDRTRRTLEARRPDRDACCVHTYTHPAKQPSPSSSTC